MSSTGSSGCRHPRIAAPLTIAFAPPFVIVSPFSGATHQSRHGVKESMPARSYQALNTLTRQANTTGPSPAAARCGWGQTPVPVDADGDRPLSIPDEMRMRMGTDPCE